MIRPTGLGAVATLVLGLLPVVAKADSLRDALADAYRLNQAIAAERAAVRSKDELVPQARANLWLPHVTLNASATHTDTQDVLSEKFSGVAQESQNQDRVVDDGIAELDLAITLYDSGRTPAQIAYAEQLIEVERGVLINTEQQVFLAAAQDYGQIVYAGLLIDLAQEQISDLETIRAAGERALATHLVTVTDVAQIAAQLDSARADYQQASGNLQAARAQLAAVIGRPAGDIDGWPPLPALPASMAAAEAIALAENPQLAAGRAQIAADEYAVKGAETQLLPIVSLEASGSKDFNGTRYTDEPPLATATESFLTPLPKEAVTHPATAVIGITLSWPLYQGGGEYGAIREQKQILEQARDTLDDTTRGVVGTLRAYWQNLAAADAQVATTADEVKSSRQALNGIERQFHESNATIIDVIQLRQRLNAATEAADLAQLDQYTDRTQLFAAMGRFTAAGLALPVVLYDPRVHYREVHDKLFGVGNN